MTRRVGVIGCGWWGRNLVRNFAQLGALAAVADTDTQAATRASEEFKVPALDPDAMLARSDLEGVVIAAPAHAHAELALRALAAGKHVLVEKPLALRMEDAERVVEAARRHGRILMVGHLLQYHPVFLRLCELVSEGTLGRLQYVYSNRLNLGRIRREENVFWSFAPHDISMILRLVGETPDRVEASGACYLHNHIADVTNTWLSFPSGIHAHVFVSWLHPFKEQKLVVVGTEAMAVFDDQRPWTEKLQLFRHRISWHNGLPEPSKAEAEPIAVEPAEPLAMECGHFLECLATGASPRTDGEEGLKVLKVLTQAERSIARSRVAAVSAPASIEDGDGVIAHESAYVDEGCRIGERTRIWHFSHILKGSRIGRRCTIGQNVMIGPDAVVGDGCKIQNNVSVYKGVVLEDDVFCGPSAVFTNVLNPRAHVERKEEFRTTHVGKGATIGANATIICGVRLGRYCLVGAGAVVTRDVPPHALVTGVPARQVGWVSHDGEQLDERLVCPRSGRRYHPDGSGGLAEIDGVEALSG